MVVRAYVSCREGGGNDKSERGNIIEIKNRRREERGYNKRERESEEEYRGWKGEERDREMKGRREEEEERKRQKRSRHVMTEVYRYICLFIKGRKEGSNRPSRGRRERMERGSRVYGKESRNATNAATSQNHVKIESQ